MKAKLFVILAALCLLYGLASAQAYSIRITFNTNLRAAANLGARIIETAPAGATLNVVGNYDRWLRIDRNGAQVYMADWVSYTRVEDTAPTQTQTQTQTQANIDNCCFVDRQCNTDQEWTDGYWAFQNGQCAAPSASQTQTSTQTTTADSGQINNCCFTGWQCDSDEDWRNGYHAYQNNQCGPSQLETSSRPVSNLPAGVDNCCQLGWFCTSDDDWRVGLSAFQKNRCKRHAIVFEGIPRVVARVQAALDLLRSRAPRWYDYAVNGYDRIVGAPDWHIVQGHEDELLAIFSPQQMLLDETDGWPVERAMIESASTIIHYACHGHRKHAGLVVGATLESEGHCLTKEIEAMEVYAPDDPSLGYMRHQLENLENIEYQWWH